MEYLSCCLTYIYIYILCVYIFYIHNHPEINRMDFANKKHHGNTRLLNLFHIPFCIYSRTLGRLFIAIWLTGWPVTFMLSRKLSIIENGQILGRCCSPHWMILQWISRYPLVNVYITMENHHFEWENPLFLWSFSIAMLNYQRVFESLEKRKTTVKQRSV